MRSLLKETLYLLWKLYNRLKKIKNEEKKYPTSYYFGLALQNSFILYALFILIIAIFFPHFFKNQVIELVNTNRIKFLIRYILISLPFIMFFYKYYVKHNKEFIERLKKEKQYIKEFKERLNKDSKTDKFEENIPKEEYCIDCKKSFSEVKRFENTNLCEKCFNKELSDDSKSNENQRQVFH